MVKATWAAALIIGLACQNIQAGVLNPDCTAEKAAKSTAMKATVGVGGRCSPKEAAADSVGLDDKKDAASKVKEQVGNKVDKATDNLGNKTIKKAVNN